MILAGILADMTNKTNQALQAFANTVANFCNEVQGKVAGLEARAALVDRLCVDLVDALQEEQLTDPN